MDIVSGRVCYRHLESLKSHNFVCVTASVDSIRTFPSGFDIQNDMKLEGYLAYTGKRTMEVRVELKDLKDKTIMYANYLFVAKPHSHLECINDDGFITFKELKKPFH